MSDRIWTGVVTSYEVRYADGTSLVVTTGMPDALRWERNHDGKSLVGAQSLTTMLTLVWYALRREHRTDITPFEAWAATVVDIARVEDADDDEDDGVGPTSPDQSEH